MKTEQNTTPEINPVEALIVFIYNNSEYFDFGNEYLDRLNRHIDYANAPFEWGD